MTNPVLYVFAGLPGSGKSTLARAVAEARGHTWLRIDTIEQALRDLLGADVGGEGYRLAYRVAADNLRAGNSVIADSCNPIALTRDEWSGVAASLGYRACDIEVVCSDPIEHRGRVEQRRVDVPGLQLPTWQAVLDREYHPFTGDRIRIDTAGRAEADCVSELLARLDEWRAS